MFIYFYQRWYILIYYNILEEDIYTIHKLGGIELLLKIVNSSRYTNKEISEMIVKSITSFTSKLSLELMDETIIDKSLIRELKFRKATSFKYLSSYYHFLPNEYIRIKPITDSKCCRYSISPDLPVGLTINSKTGEIFGTVRREFRECKYTVICVNICDIISCELNIKIEKYQFVNDFSSKLVLLEKNRKVWKKTKTDNSWAYLNIRMEYFVYYIKYRFKGKDNDSENKIILGGDKNYNHFSLQEKYYGIELYKNGSSLINSDATIVTEPKITNHGNGSIYELIYDMKHYTLSIIHDNQITILMQDLPSVLYPCVEILELNGSIELISVKRKEDNIYYNEMDESFCEY